MNKYLKLSLLSLTIILLLCHLSFIDQQQKGNLLSLHFLGLIVVLNSIWQKRNQLDLMSNAFSTCCGFMLITLTLIRSQMPLGYNPHLSIMIMAISIILMSSKFKTIKQYQPELLIIFFLGLYPIFNKLLVLINLPLITAKLSSFLLWLIGSNPQQQGTIITLPTGRIEVYGSCSGIELLIFMVFVVFVFILNFPLNLFQKIVFFTVAIFVALFTNSLRVGILAIFVANNDFTSFNYWHGDGGGWLFSIIAVTLFAIFNWYWYLQPLIINLNKKG